LTQPGDTLVLIALFAVILYLSLKNFIPVFRSKKNDPVKEIKGEVPDLLREKGYEVVRARERVPLQFDVNGESYESRIYIDYVARRDGEWFLVITARDRKPLRMSGAGLRDFFLPYYSIFQPDGILYVNKEKRTIKVVRFDIPELSFEKKKLSIGWVTFVAACLVLVLVWILE
jgi:hypothetical protein